MKRIFLFAMLSGLAFAAFAEDSVMFFERPVSDAEKKQFFLKENLFFFKEDFDGIREMFRTRKWGPEVVKVQLRRVAKKDAEPEMAKIPGYSGQKEGTPFVYVSYLGETFYTGKIDEETKQKHALRVNRVEVERLATIEQVRSEYAQKKWSPKIVSVELLYGGMDILYPYIRPYVQITQLGEEKQAQTELNAARGKMQKEFGIGKDALGWKYRGCGFNPLMTETFEHADKRKVEVVQVEGENEAAALHELRRPCVEFESEIVGSKFGPVIFSSVPAVSPDGAPRFQTRTSWLSGTNHVISVSAMRTGDSDPGREFSELLGEKYPSALKADFKIDKAAWAREEAAQQLARMSAALKDSREDFLERHAALCKVLRLPSWLAFKTDYDLNAQQQVLREIEEWWAVHRDKCVWDETLARLLER
jgi:hypothetical protein